MIKKKLILVADRREDSLVLFHQVLRRFGYDVVLANSAEETLDQARRHRPDLVLLDLSLSTGDEIAPARRLRDDPRTSATPLVAVSAQESPTDERLRDQGFCGVVTRQSKLEAMLAVVRSCLSAGEAAIPAPAGA